MDIKPIDITHQEFPRGFRGYNIAEVRQFLEKVASSVQQLLEETENTKNEMETLKEQLARYHNLEDTLQKTLILAQKTAEEITENARKEAGLIIEQARLEEKKFRDDFARLKATKEDFESQFQALLETFLKRLERSGYVEGGGSEG
ncbi:MAG: DivIVA domain-containing protein [bacterium]